ncbi:N-acetylmuramidase domain-containing protein [Flectobacillus longus]|uniref:N-acetylmuramidase domain-containing protein n=1 Tax=Flectobacillus longus TaxID=2984207 RepID=UPI0024B83128|nr:N-acetylmuramidase domain-containing protein [Flectobacillus longus]MDI9881040.1 N-acetylmuramidase domain-containing protein [Flectobacillus longus]
MELLPHDASGVQVYSSKKDQYDDLAVKISGNSLIFNDYQSPTTKTLTLKTDNNDQTTLVEKWLFEKAKVMDEGTNSNDILDDETFKKYAKLAGIKDFIAFKAFTVVESGGNGFFEVEGKKVPKLLFERHLMYKCLRDGKIWGVVASNDPRKDNNIVLSELLENRPEIVSKTGFEWCKKCSSSNTYVIKGENCETNSHNEIWFYNNCYIPTTENYEKRFLEAVEIHKECAYMATSWGIGQVIGANFRNEFNSIDEMEKELMNGNSSSQLFIMASFIKNNSTLKNAINDKEWAIAASEYNGPNYSKNKYDEKLKKEYEKLKK